MEESRLEISFAEAERFFAECDPVEDVLVLGYVDRDNSPPTFQLSPTIVALESGLGFLTLTWNHSGRFTLSLPAEPAIPQDLAEEPSIEPMYASVAQNYLAEGLDLILTGARLIHDKAAPNEYVAAWFEFDSGIVLFVDAVTSSGLLISTVPEIGYRPKTSTVFEGEFVEFDWTRTAPSRAE
jgi:hypothetical protein